MHNPPRFALALSALALVSAPLRAGPAWDAGKAKDLAAVAYASACDGKDIQAWSCPWCKKGGAYAALKVGTYATDAPTAGAGFTAWNEKTNEILVVYRSTVLTRWESVMVDFTFAKKDYKSRDGAVRGQVHTGFHDAWGALDRAGLASSMDSLVKAHPAASLVAVGHSLGGALATHAAAELVQRFPGKPVLVYSFGSPRVGDKAFAAWFASLPITYYRVVTQDDPVPHTPKLVQGFLHVGSGQEKWYEHIGDAAPKDCGTGENGACANTVKLPTNFAGAHANYLGHVFDQCGIGPIAAIHEWVSKVKHGLADAYDEARDGLGKANDAAKDDAAKAREAADAAAKMAKEEAVAAAKKAKEAEEAAAKKAKEEAEAAAAKAKEAEKKAEKKAESTGEKLEGGVKKAGSGAKKIGKKLGIPGL